MIFVISMSSLHTAERLTARQAKCNKDFLIAIFKVSTAVFRKVQVSLPAFRKSDPIRRYLGIDTATYPRTFQS
jgi:hypothetical protein